MGYCVVFGITYITRTNKIINYTSFQTCFMLTFCLPELVYATYLTYLLLSFHQILLLLKRGLTQQGSVRSDIYNRLASILRNNSKLYPMILQLLEERLVAVTEQDPGNCNALHHFCVNICPCLFIFKFHNFRGGHTI